jgi:hypothetical protein
VPDILADGGDEVHPRPVGARKGIQPSGVVAGSAEAPVVCLSLRTARMRPIPAWPIRTASSNVARVREGHGPKWPAFLRTARTRSLPWDPVGGAQSSVRNIPADGGDAVPPDLLDLAKAPAD